MNFFQFNFQFFASNPLRQNGCNTQVVKKCLWARAVKVKFSAQISPIFHFLVTFKNWISDIVTALVEFPFLLNFMVQFRKLQYSKVKLSQKKRFFFWQNVRIGQSDVLYSTQSIRRIEADSKFFGYPRGINKAGIFYIV